MELKSLLDHPNKLPTIPKVTQQLIASFSSEDISIDEIARQLAADPVLSAKLLRLANSAYFHVSRTIGTVHDALLMLGFVMVRNLVIGNGMVTAFRNTPGMNMPQFWLHSLYTACASRWLAGQADANPDMNFTLGLMHGIGQLQMHAGMPADMVALDQQMNVLDGGRAVLEQQALGFHFGEVSAELVKLWNFPEPLIDALHDVQDPLAAEQFSASAAVVHLAAWRARTEVLAMSDEQVAASYPAEVARRLGITPDWVPALAEPAYGRTTPAMPPLKVLAEGLDEMLS